ncbi:12251_t:CDS:2 [Funneliformis geosporum]|nr:12251_t:CDS:2 [Funneliformis geosporum]
MDQLDSDQIRDLINRNHLLLLPKDIISKKNKKEAKKPNASTIYRCIFIKTMELNGIPFPPLKSELKSHIHTSWDKESMHIRTLCKEISEQSIIQQEGDVEVIGSFTK